MSLKRRVGMIDSGLGGLTVLAELRALTADVDVFYFADTANVPYGDRPLSEVALFGRQMIDWLARFEPAVIVIASGTTCAAFEDLRWPADAIPRVGVAATGAAAGLAASRTHNVGVIATRGTIDSGIFERKIHELDPTAVVTAVAAPALVPIVESGEWGSDDARAAVSAATERIVAANCDALILGCTHFPHLRRWFSAALGPDVVLIDPAESCAQAVAQVLTDAEPGTGRLTFAVSGDVDDFARHALQLSGFVANDTCHVGPAELVRR